VDDRSGLLDRNAAATERLRALVARLAPPDLGCALGGGWTVAFALCHLAFWDARQRAALERYARGEDFAEEDVVANQALEAVSGLLAAGAAGTEAVRAAEAVDAQLAALPPARRDALLAGGCGFAVERWRHRDEHIAQIERALS